MVRQSVERQGGEGYSISLYPPASSLISTHSSSLHYLRYLDRVDTKVGPHVGCSLDLRDVARSNWLFVQMSVRNSDGQVLFESVMASVLTRDGRIASGSFVAPHGVMTKMVGAPFGQSPLGAFDCFEFTEVGERSASESSELVDFVENASNVKKRPYFESSAVFASPVGDLACASASLALAGRPGTKDGKQSWSSGSLPAVGVDGPRLMGVDGALLREIMDVHGYKMLAEYDPRITEPGDVDRIEAALNRYPEAWIHGAARRACQTGEQFPRFRLVEAQMFPASVREDAAHLYGYFERDTNTVYLNMELHNRYASSSDFQAWSHEEGRGDRNELLGTHAIHEFAHYLDDASWRDSSGPTGPARFEKASDIPTAPLRAHDGSILEGPSNGAFRARILERNRSSDSGDYIDTYDWATNHGHGNANAKVGEAFASLVTALVVGGEARSRMLLGHTKLGGPTRQVLDFLNNDLDSSALVYDRSAGESKASRTLSEEQTVRYNILGVIDTYMKQLGVPLTPERKAWLRDASLSELGRLRDHLDVCGRWP